MTKIIFEDVPFHVENIKSVGSTSGENTGKNIKTVVFGYPKLSAFADVAQGYNGVADWQHSGNSKYIKDHPKSLLHARQLVADFKFPEELRAQAHFLSRELVGALEVDGAPKIMRKQPSGRFDPKAMKRVVQDLQSGKFSRETTRPYLKRERVAPKPPHVAIVADGSARAMWSSEEYIPRVATTMLGITWACEAVNCQTTTAIVRASAGSNQDFDLICYILNDEDITTPLNAYAPLFHRDLYRGANLSVFASHEETIRLLCKGSSRLHAQDISTSSGNGGYSWAKSRGADIIITVGDIAWFYGKDPLLAKKNAESHIHIDSGTDLKAAIKIIAKKLLELKYLKEVA